MKDQLATIVKESGLGKTKAQVLLDNFSDYFQVASEWEKRAKTIMVTDASQEADMKVARVGRLFLRQKRIAIEHTRKELKEQSLREGKAIDGIANVLKALIVPIEEYLEQQEKYIEIKSAEEAKLKQIEEEKKAEEERIALEKAEAEALRKEADEEAKERERIRKENEKLRKEAKEREEKIAEERIKEREEAECALREERRRHKEDLQAERAKAWVERVEDEKAAMIKCPFCHKSFKPEKEKS